MNDGSGCSKDNGGDSNGDDNDDYDGDDNNDADEDKMPLPPLSIYYLIVVCQSSSRHVARYSCHSANQYTCSDWQSGRTI